MGLRGQLRRLKQDASKGAVLIHGRDGSVRAFDVMTVWKEMFLANMDLLRGKSSESEVLKAVRSATPESRREFEERFGSITMTARVICPEVDGGWVEEFNLLEDGRVKRTLHEGGSDEAKRLREEARYASPKSF